MLSPRYQQSIFVGEFVPHRFIRFGISTNVRCITWYSWWLKQPPSGPRPSFLAARRWAWCRRQATVMAATRTLPMHAMATRVPKAQLERGRTGVARGRDFPLVLCGGREGCREGGEGWRGGEVSAPRQANTSCPSLCSSPSG